MHITRVLPSRIVLGWILWVQSHSLLSVDNEIATVRALKVTLCYTIL